MNQTNHFKRQAGFTLIELLVAIAIVGLLAGIVSISVGQARIKARDAKRVGDVKQMITAMEQYYIRHGVYPTGTASVESAGTGALLSDPNALNGGPEAFSPEFIPFVPTAPAPADGDCAGSGEGKNNYWYEVADNGSSYTLTFCLGKNTNEWKAGTRQATANGVR